MDGTVLVADDDRTIRTVLTQALTRAGCRVHATSSLTTLMRWVEEGKGDLVISDVMMPDGNGLEMLPKIAKDRPNLPVIVISAQNTIMTAIQAAEAKAFDYLPKPFDLPDLMKRCARALEQSRAKRGVTRPEAAPVGPEGADAPLDLPLVGRTPVMQDLYRLVARVLNADLPVLISGESGSGKSLLARAVHDFSDRRNLPYVVVTGDDLVSLEGPSRVMAKAQSGTIVIDELGDIPFDVQSRIVRMIDGMGETSPRFIATLQGDPSAAVDDGRVRQDLFYRVGGATLNMPALRERVDDIVPLCEFFLAKAEREGQNMRKISTEAEKLLRNYQWPGNVRQLENLIRRLGLTARGAEISEGELRQALENQPQSDALLRTTTHDKLSADVERHLRRYFDLHGAVMPPPGLYSRILREIEVPLLEVALEATGGNQLKCAELLGLNRNTLRKKIHEYDIRVARGRKLM